MDQRIRLRAPDRRTPRPAHPPRPYPGNERRLLSPETLQGPAPTPARPGYRLRRRFRYRRNPRHLTRPSRRLERGLVGPSSNVSVADFYSAPLAGFASAVDIPSIQAEFGVARAEISL